MSAATDRFETIAWIYDQGDLAIILSRLEHADIWAVPLGYHQIAAQWYLTVGLGGVELRVHAEDAVAARALFAEIDWQPSRRGLFSDNRLVEIVLILLVFGLILMAPPARLAPSFVGFAPAQARAER